MSKEVNNARTKLLGHFSNQSQLGVFGEFVYKKYCESLGFDIERTNFCHTDFLLHSKDSGKILQQLQT